MKKLKTIFFISLASLTLVACGGGGGGGGGSTGGGGGTNPPATQDKNFTVSLNSVDITRTSNSETVTVDTSTVTTGQLTFTE